jgi:predicted Holliday junction resolvase-like endonuclease
MPKSSNALITELQRNKRFMGTCPACGEDFRLADAVLFSLDEDTPTIALAAIQQIRLQIKARKDQLIQDRELMTKRAQNTAAAVNLGKIIEKIVPSFSSFAHASGDCRALFEPIDYIIFSGLTKNHQVDSLLFVDVKSGNARLNKTQRSIKKAVDAGAVSFGTTHS